MENIDFLDYHENLQEQQIGAKVLSTANFQESNKGIVESSFNKAVKRGEKLSGKNAERRNMAYLDRLQRLVDKYGNALEKKLWDASKKRIDIIQPEDFEEPYWKSVEKDLRDNGYGHTLQQWEKDIEIKDAQKLQRGTLEEWANYLGDEKSPYPMWFKVYAWDGVTKMGGYNREKHSYGKRDIHTVAPYPDCDAEILSTIYGYVNSFYNIPEHALYTEDGDRDKELEAIVASGNFSKLYSLAEREKSPIVPTPERPEDIHGEWVAYRPGDEKEMARASRGTGWCTKNPAVARSYLRNASYGHIEYDDCENLQDSKAVFWVFHLYDPNNKNRLAQNGCLAILVDGNGNVTKEVRGLAQGQDIEDSLIPTLEKKLETLTGSGKKLAEVLDRKTLIMLDNKMQNGEDLTKEELEFLYEINRPIETLDTYNHVDPRIPELKEKYNIEYALDAGINIDNLVSRLDSYHIAENLDTLIQHGANIDIDNLVSNLDPYDIAYKFLDTLIQHSANMDIDNLVSHLDPVDIVDNLDTLIQHGANIDDLVSHLDPGDISFNLDTLIQHGANIDIDNLVSHLDLFDITHDLDALIQHGADIDISNLVSRLGPSGIAYHLDTLIQHGADIDISNLVSNLDPSGIAYNLDALIQHGANIDIDNLVSNLDPSHIVPNLDTLIQHGANIDQIAEKLKSDGFDATEYLAEYGYTE